MLIYYTPMGSLCRMDLPNLLLGKVFFFSGLTAGPTYRPLVWHSDADTPLLLPSPCQFQFIRLYLLNMPINISALGVTKLRGYREFVSARDIVHCTISALKIFTLKAFPPASPLHQINHFSLYECSSPGYCPQDMSSTRLGLKTLRILHKTLHVVKN